MKSFMDKAFWGETKSFLLYKGASVELKRAKNTCEPVFSITNKTTAADCHCRRTTPQGEKPFLQLTFIRP
jgi:hypothetical protein